MSTRLSRYELLEEIGRGNMGVVYKARDPEIDRLLAIKVVRLGFSLDERQRQTYVERFRREAKIAGNLVHPHIVSVYDIDFSGDEPFIAMEYFPGVGLGTLVADTAGPSPREVAIIVHQLASALDYAHREGVVHRDIKPANVLYQPGPMIKLVDFGIAKVGAVELTATGEFIGTPSYMSPEIFAGDLVDARSDLFSLGVILYQLLTGVRPFEADNVSRTIYRVLHDDPPPPSSERPGLSPAWDRICERLLAKDPAERYASAADLRRDLDALEQGTLVVQEPTVPIPAPKSHRVPLLTAGVLLLVLLGAVWFWPRVPAPSKAAAVSVAPLAADTKRALDDGRLDDGEALLNALVAHEPDHPDAPSLRAELDERRFDASLPIRFVARHEHRVGFCTGDMTFASDALVFESPRESWRVARSELDSLRLDSEEALTIRRDGDTIELTMIRPPLTREIVDRYRRSR